jgi:putative oxidoreductase
MWQKLLATDNSAARAIVRIMLGFVMFPHGAQLMLGWFGGRGFSASMTGFEASGIPAAFACLAIAAEFFGAIGLIAGFLSRVAALGIFSTMLVAIVKVHWQNGLFMNWTGAKHGEGFEFHLLMLAMAMAVMLAGAGAVSIDRMLSRKPKRA